MTNIMYQNSFDFNYLLLENYKALNISEDELVVLLMIDHAIKDGTYFITGDILCLKMTMDNKKIDRILSNLLIKGYISFENKDGKTVTSLEPLNNRLIKMLEITLSKEENKTIKENKTLIIKEISNSFKRELSPIEINKVNEWFALGYDFIVIMDAIKNAISEEKFTLLAIEKNILTIIARQDMESDGRTSLNSSWNKSLEETIRIAKTPWIDKKDE